MSNRTDLYLSLAFMMMALAFSPQWQSLFFAFGSVGYAYYFSNPTNRGEK